MEFTITKEQILNLAECGGAAVSLYLNREFPEAFKTKLEVGKWYVPEREKGSLWFIESVNEDGFGEGYGLCTGIWEECDRIEINEYRFEWREASPEEIESALIAEAKRRGFVNGAKFKSSLSENGKIRTVRKTGDWYFYIYANRLNISTPESEWENSQSNPTIFANGKWAEILPTEKTAIPREKALKILAKKLKVSPGNIEIE